MAATEGCGRHEEGAKASADRRGVWPASFRVFPTY